MKKYLSHKQKKLFSLLAVLTLAVCLPVVCLAEETDPLAVVNNLQNFMFGLIKAIGAILLCWGIVQVGLALKSHDPSQRANGFLTVAGGVIIMFSKEILSLITGG